MKALNTVVESLIQGKSGFTTLSSARLVQTLQSQMIQDQTFSGRSSEEIATAIFAAMDKQLADYHAQTGATLLRPDLSKITAEKVALHLPPREVVNNITAIRPDVVIAAPKPPGVVGTFKKMSGADQVGIGLSAMLAGMSLYSGIASAVGIYKSTQNKGEDTAPVPLSTYGLTAAQLLLGVGMAVLTHHHYQAAAGAVR